MQLSICCWVSISGLHWVPMYVGWLLKFLRSCISRTLNVVLMDSLGVMYVFFLVCLSASCRGAFSHAWVGGDCIVVGDVDVGEVFLVDVLVPCCMDELCWCCCVFGQLRVLLVCWLY